MKASALFILLSLCGCQRTTGGDDGPAPAASNIPRAAPHATGASYPPPKSYPPGITPPSPVFPPPPELHDPFGKPPPTPLGLGGGGTHL